MTSIRFTPRRESYPIWMVAALCLVALAFAMLLATPSSASAAGTKGNASAALGFIEHAQNSDGGFGTKQGEKSSPAASLWAAVALLAGGKNPNDEWIKNGQSLEQYLTSHTSSYTSLLDLGLLTMVQYEGELPASYLGSPEPKLAAELTAGAAKTDPEAAAIGIFALIADGSTAAKAQATSIAEDLTGDVLSDGGWGPGQSTSVSTALVLQALAVSGVGSSGTPVVQGGISYLHKAQGNDGSIATSDRTDLALESGDVTATAFTAQALQALGEPPLTNSTGKTVLVGLTQYQQKASGGLCDDCAYYSSIKPFVTQTAQAFAAFDGIVFPSAPVAPSSSGPPPPSHSKAPTKTKQESGGTAKQGVSGNQRSAKHDAGAFKHATAAPSSHSKHGAKSKHGSGSGSGGTSVTGSVVNSKPTPKLVTAAGQSSGGLTAQDKAAIGLGVLLLAALGLGSLLDSRRPRPGNRSGTAVAVQAGADLWHQAKVRGALAPAAALLVGLALVAVPIQTGMFSRAPQGAAMIRSFKPYMTTPRIAKYQQDVSYLNAGITQAADKGPALLYPHASAAVAKRKFAASQQLLEPVAVKWPGIRKTFGGLLGTIHANVGRYQQIAALPSFSAFPWFFVGAGALLTVLALIAIAATFWHKRLWRSLRWAVLAAGVALVLAPAALSMWSRAPAGARLVGAFQHVETRGLVTKVQGDFGQLAVVEGALAGQLVPALRASGSSTATIDRQLPGVTALDTHWVRILGDLTPLIGVMSNNVGNYQAVAALPSFSAFPWLLTIPGLLAILIVLLPGRRLPVGRTPLRGRLRGGFAAEAPSAPAEAAAHQPAAAPAPSPAAAAAASPTESTPLVVEAAQELPIPSDLAARGAA